MPGQLTTAQISKYESGFQSHPQYSSGHLPVAH
jgi:hypothetical protein